MTGQDLSEDRTAPPLAADSATVRIPFGAARLSSAPGASVRAFAAMPGSGPLRLSSGVIGVAGAPGVPSADDQFAALRARILTLADPWSRSMRAFVDGYFAFVADEVARSRDEIAARLADFHGLYTPEDLRFAAWLPLPMAHLPAAEGYRLVPFAFWSGTAVVAVDLGGGAAPVGIDDPRLPTEAIRIDRRDLARDPVAALRAGLPAAAIRFWADAGVPSAPARTDAATLALPA